MEAAQGVVPGAVAAAVVRPLQVVDVDEGEMQRVARAARALELVTDQDFADPTPEGAGQVVELGAAELRLQVQAIERRRLAIVRRLAPVGRRPGPCLCRPLPRQRGRRQHDRGPLFDVTEPRRQARGRAIGTVGGVVPHRRALVPPAGLLVAAPRLHFALGADPHPGGAGRDPHGRPTIFLQQPGESG